MNKNKVSIAVILFASLYCLSFSYPAFAFTQKGAGTIIANGVPMGHEWITRLSVLELIGGDPIMQPDPNDPRKTGPKAKQRTQTYQHLARKLKLGA